MNLGNRFKRIRQKNGLKQKEAAELIGVNNYQLGNYETNRSEPSIDVLKKMSQVYGVSVDYLIGNFLNVNKGSKQEHEITDYDELMDAINNYLEEYKRSKS